MSSPPSRLPSFLIIGAAKAGTTWLARSLSYNPGIFMPTREVHYFSRHFGQPRSWYESHFRDAPAHAVIGERSNTYFHDCCAPSRIKDCLDHPRQIVLLRNPVERAYSDYCMHFARGTVAGTPEEVLAPEGPMAATNLFLEQGRYATLIDRYHRLFSPAQIEVVLYDDIVAHPQQVLEATARFLGADPSPSPPTASEPANRRRTAREPEWLRILGERLTTRASFPTPLLAFLRRAARLVSQPIRYPELDPRLHTRLVRYYSSEVQAIEELLGRNLDSWRSEEPEPQLRAG